MIFALGSTGNLLSVSLLYLAINVGSIVLLVRSFLRRACGSVVSIRFICGRHRTEL